MLYLKRSIYLFFLLAGLAVSSLDKTDAGPLSNAEVLRAVNLIRSQHRLAPLKLHPALQKAAREQSRLMARAGKMSHKIGWRNSFSARMKRVGYRRLAAENIAYGQASLDRVLKAWMNSRGHRRNMLHPRMRYFGLVYSERKGLKYWTMVLGG